MKRLILPGAVVAIIVLLALAAPLLPLPNPVRMDVAHRLAGPAAAHLLGQDEYGRDVLSRLLWGARASLTVALSAALIACVVGTALGILGGYLRGLAELFTLRVADVILCFPPLLLALLVVTLLGPGAFTLILVLSVLYTPGFTRVTYGSVLGARSRDYVEAVRVLGASRPRIMLRTILPNVLGPVLVQISLTAAAAIVLESGLSFLGLGVVPPAPSWGLMIRGGRDTMDQAPLLLLWPCLALTITILAINALCDALQIVVDPRAANRPKRVLDRVLPGLAPAPRPATADLLQVRNLTLEIATAAGPIRPVQDVSLGVARGQTLALVGESGSGKTLTGLAALGLLPEAARVVAGHVWVGADDIVGATPAILRRLRGGTAAMVFQDSLSSMNPVHRVGDQIAEAMTGADTAAPHHRPAHPRGHSRTRAPRPRLSARDVRRHAPARHDRDGACPRARAPDRRRTHHRTRRHRPGAGARPAARPAARARAGDGVHHPQPARGGRDRRPGRRHVLRRDRGTGQRGRRLRPTAASLHRRAARQRAARGWQLAARHRRHGSAAARATAGLPLRPALHPSPPRLRHASRARDGWGPRDTVPSLARACGMIEAQGVSKHFAMRGLFSRAAIRAVQDVSLTIQAGDALGLVGESGSGKSTLGRILLGLLPPSAGRVTIHGQDLAGASPAQLKQLRRRMQLVFQDPYSSLDPRRRIGAQIADGLAIHRLPNEPGRVVELLDRVGLPAAHANRFPHEFSGGQRQRIAIARALATGPELLVADEPVSALDVSVQAQILALFAELRSNLGLALLFISHDLPVVRSLCDRVAVLYLGRIVETGPAAAVFDRPLHPYTQALLSAAPSLHPGARRDRIILQGEPPSPLNPPSGCVFRTRCPRAIDSCAHDIPPLRQLAPDHQAACIRL